MSYYRAPSLTELLEEVDKRYPDRNKAWDGWIGDPSHQARVSDHNPDYSAGGVVRAQDITTEGNEELRLLLLNSLIGDPRVWYVISHGVIYSRTHGWSALRYAGDPHAHHVHVSLLHTKEAETNLSVWLDPVKVERHVGSKVSVRQVRMQFRVAVETGKVTAPNYNIKRVQRALGITVDGQVGPKTIAAWAKFEANLPKSQQAGRNKIPDSLSLAALSKGRFTLVS